MSTESLLAQRYARALFDLANEGKALDAVKKDVTALQALLVQSAELRQLLSSPVIGREDSAKALEAVMKQAKVNDLTRKFFALLSQQRRLAIASAAMNAYLEMLAASRDEATADIVSATKLDKAQVDALVNALGISTGKKIEARLFENPELLGGVQIRIGSQMLDSSVAGKLDRLKLALTKVA